MNVELIAIGDEILLGCIENSNATFMSKELLKAGFSVTRHTTLSDDDASLLEGIKEAINRSDLVITTGGLGPTLDDKTRRITADLMGSKFHFDKTVADHIEKRFGDKIVSLKDQATLPVKATPLLNQIGTAPGLIFTTEHGALILLPGVPVEMRPLLTEQVIPYLKQTFPQATTSHSYWYNFCLITESSIDATLREIATQFPQIEMGIYPHQGSISVRMTVHATSESEAKKLLDPPGNALLNSAPGHHFEANSGRLEEAVHNLFIERGLTLSLAESCTGGAIAAHLTALSGASNYFLGSFVTYSNDLKQNLLGVKKETLHRYGAVSEETALEMAQGALKAAGSDVAVAISGIAGPLGGSEEKPVGTICISIAQKGKEPQHWVFHARGNREHIIKRAVNHVLAKLHFTVKSNVSISR